MKEQDETFLTVPCSTCNVPRGKPCCTLHGLPMRTGHIARRRYAHIVAYGKTSSYERLRDALKRNH